MIWFETAGGSCLPVGLRLLLETYLGTRLIFLGWCRSAPALPPCAVLALLSARSSTSTGKTTAAELLGCLVFFVSRPPLPILGGVVLGAGTLGYLCL